MNPNEESHKDELIDSLLHEQVRQDREKAIRDIENALLVDAVQNSQKASQVDWRRLALSTSVAAVVVLGIGLSLSMFITYQETKNEQKPYFFVFNVEDTSVKSQRPLPKEIVQKIPAAPPTTTTRVFSPEHSDPNQLVTPNLNDIAMVGAVAHPRHVSYDSAIHGNLIDRLWSSPLGKPVSSFSMDVDHASYANVRKLIREGRTVSRDEVRIEECINAFDYDYEAPGREKTFAVHVELTTCPWNDRALLVKFGIKGREAAALNGAVSSAETIAEDARIQVEFNPQLVSSYRLIGHANRIVEGQTAKLRESATSSIASGQEITAFYEVIPANGELADPKHFNGLKYQKSTKQVVGPGDEWLTIKLHYKQPESDAVVVSETVLKGKPMPWKDCSADDRFAASVALFGMKLRDMSDVGKVSWKEVREMAESGLGNDPNQERAEFIGLIQSLEERGH